MIFKLSCLPFFHGRTQPFIAGSLAAYSHIWQDLTSDPEILETVTGLKIQFDTWPMQLNAFDPNYAIRYTKRIC